MPERLNILIENLRPSDATRRWGKALTSSGAFVPKHLLDTMSKDDMDRLGIAHD